MEKNIRFLKCKTCCTLAFFVVILLAKVNYAEFELGIQGAVGYSLLPKQVSGNVVDLHNYQWINSSYVGSTDQDIYPTQYTYHHPFPKENAPTMGFRLAAQYLFPERFGIGFEYENGYSIQDYSENQMHTDSSTNMNAVIPASYQIKWVSSQNTIQMRHSLFALTLSHRKQMTNKISLGGLIGLGWAQYVIILKTENQSSINKYYQRNGHEVYSESLALQPFSVTGIEYSAFYIRPEIFARYELSKHVGLLAGLSMPFSFVDRGIQWSDDNGSSNYTSTIFYPNKRFFAGALSLSAGICIAFGPGMNEEVRHE